MDTTAPWDRLARRARTFGSVPATELSDDDREHVLVAPTLVGLPDGRAGHLVHVLDRQWFTQRVRATTRDRDDLWVTSALAPLVTALVEGPLPLLGGGQLRIADHFQRAVVGPPGWLPDVPAGGVVALRLIRGSVEITAIETVAATPQTDQDLRELLGLHYRNERWFVDDEPTTRITLTRAVAASVLEVPTAFVEPRTPLDELLRDPLQEGHRHHWRDLAAWQEGSVSFSVVGMPEALHMELSKRADTYGMSLDEYVIAVLGHLAWRTPFAEDLGPFESWVDEPDKSSRGCAPCERTCLYDGLRSADAADHDGERGACSAAAGRGQRARRRRGHPGPARPRGRRRRATRPLALTTARRRARAGAPGRRGAGQGPRAAAERGSRTVEPAGGHAARRGTRDAPTAVAVDAFDADVLIYAADPDHPLGSDIRSRLTDGTGWSGTMPSCSSGPILRAATVHRWTQ